jgi:hypothetical protein
MKKAAKKKVVSLEEIQEFDEGYRPDTKRRKHGY